MSPEQAKAKRISLDHRTDVYSLGATLYETLTGEPPLRGKDQHDTLSQIIVRDPPSLRQLNSRVPKDLGGERASTGRGRRPDNLPRDESAHAIAVLP